MSDLQKTFDKVARHLLTQKQRSRTDGFCLYRGPHGLQCAAGCLIPDELYTPSMERNPIDVLVTKFPSLRGVPEINGFATELRQLQMLHDGFEPDDWPSELRHFAGRHGLSPDVLKEFA